MRKNSERGPVATADMKARLAAGWTLEQLWDRMHRAESGDGYSYDMAESLPETSKSVGTGGLLVAK